MSGELIPDTETFFNLYSEKIIRGPKLRTSSLDTRLTNRRHQHQQGINRFLTCSVFCTPSFAWSTHVSSACRNVYIHFFLNNQPDAIIIQILFCHKTLHVSGILSAHHQEFSTAHSALVSFMQVSDDGFQAESGWNILVYIISYTGCPRRNVPDFGRVFLMLKYTDITQNTYVQS